MTFILGRCLVATIHARANVAGQLLEPIDAIEDLPDVTPVDRSADPRFEFLSQWYASPEALPIYNWILFSNNFAVRCRDGSLPASRHVLAFRSAYFKRLFTNAAVAQTRPTSHFVDFPMEIAAPVVTFILTDTFALPESMALCTLLQLLEVITALEPSEPQKLKNGIADFLHRRFEKVLASLAVYDLRNFCPCSGLRKCA